MDQHNNLYDSLDADAGFSMEPEMKPIIKVVGVGGGGNNAINHMYQQDVKGVSFVVCNTDRQALNNSPVPTRLLIGPNTTNGLGAGNIPDVAREAAEESADDIAALFDESTKMVFVTAGMGGGTGTGAAPVVARIAHEKKLLTIGIVTIPFIFEGQKKIVKALNGADEMSKYVDALLVINNERLTEIYPDLNFTNAFGKADDTLSTAARSISDIINLPGRINLDFNDVKTTLENGGVAIISSGFGEGERRVTKAIQDALNSPLLKNRDVYSAKKILINIYFSEKAEIPFQMAEVEELNEFMCNFDPNVDVIWGTANDESLGNKIKITILAAGFNVTLANDNTGPKITVASSSTAKNNAAVMDEPTVSTTAEDEAIRIRDEYGSRFNERELENARARYLILSPEEMENDDIIDLLEHTPTFRRDSKFKEKIKEMQSKGAYESGANHPAKPAANKPSGNLISFGEEM